MENTSPPKQPIGSLFDSIDYYSLEDLEKFISIMSKDQALYCLIQSVHKGFSKNIFSMQEIEVLSKSMRILTIKENQNENN
jgi:hypothetical protein